MALRPTFLAFEASRKSIMSAQKALDITGNNIGNINTAGYTRQRVDFFSVTSTSAGLRYSSRVALSGQGVYAAGVQQVRDPFLDRRYRELQADASTYGITAGILSDIEDVLDNIEATGLQDSIIDLQEKLQAFAGDSADRIELANIARTSAQNVTQMLRDYDKKLSQIMEQSKFELSTAVDNVNNIITKLAALNVQIKDEYNRSGSEEGNIVNTMMYGPNELLDARNLLLDELSQYGDIIVKNNSDGTIKVTLGGSADIVDGAALRTFTGLGDPVTDPVKLTFADDGSDVFLNTGMLKGYTDMINGNGPYADLAAGQTDVHGIPYYKSVIDAFANTFADAFNKTNGAVDVSGTLVDASKLMFSAIDDTKPISASNIKISAAWQADALMIAKVNGEYVYKDTQVAVGKSFTWEFSSPSSPAAGWAYDSVTGAYTPPNTADWIADNKSPIGWRPSSTNPLFEKNSSGEWVAKTALPAEWKASEVEYVTKATLDNSQILKLIGVFDSKVEFGSAGDFKGTMDSYIDFYTNRLGQQTEFSISQYETSGIMVNNILANRDSVSAVSMDEEGINMLNYQKWLNASSRMMTTLDEALNTIINNMGLVGR